MPSFGFLNENKAAKKAELLDANQNKKIGVSVVAKALYDVWNNMDEAAQAPYSAIDSQTEESKYDGGAAAYEEKYQ